MSDQYGTSTQPPDQYLAVVRPTTERPSMQTAPRRDGGSGFGAAALVVMVFVVIGIFFIAIPENRFFSYIGQDTSSIPTSDTAPLVGTAPSAEVTDVDAVVISDPD
jgi:hypothetical protein